MTDMDLASELQLVIERLVRRILGRMVGRLAYGLLLVALIPVVTVLGLVIFVVLGIIVFGLYTLLGEPKALSAAVGTGWFIGSLVVLFFVLRRGHRWLSRLLALADAPTSAIDPYADTELVEARRPTAWGEAPDPTTFLERLAAADARLAPPATPLDDSPDEPPTWPGAPMRNASLGGALPPLRRVQISLDPKIDTTKPEPASAL